MTHEQSAVDHGTSGPGISATSINGTAANAAQTGVAREYHDFVSDIEELIASAKASVGNLSGVIAERARSGATMTDNYVRAQPWQALGISAGLGILIGFMLGRGRRDS